MSPPAPAAATSSSRGRGDAPSARAVRTPDRQDPPRPAAPPAPPTPAGPASLAGAHAATLLAHGCNPLRLSFSDVPFDLVTDSWSERADPFMAERLRTLSESSLDGDDVWDDLPWLPFPTVIPTASGRQAEELLCRCWPGVRGRVPHNRLFPTWLRSLAAGGFHPERLPAGGAGADVDPEALAAALADTGTPVSFVALELTCNAAGGLPLSLARLRAVRDLTRAHGVPLVLDATRLLENAAAVVEGEEPMRGRGLWDAARELLAQADAVTLSAGKDFGVHHGGLVATALPEHADLLREETAARGPWAGLLERRTLRRALLDLDGVAKLVRRRLAAVTTLRQALRSAGAPVVDVPGSHCVLLDARRVPGAAGLAHPVPSVLAWLFAHTGVRGGPHLGDDGLIRLAVPVGWPRKGITDLAGRLSRHFLSPPPLTALVPAGDGEDAGSDPARAVYRPVGGGTRSPAAPAVPRDILEELEEGYAPADENAKLLAEAVPEVERHVVRLPDGDVEVFAAGDGPVVLLMHPFNMGAGVFAEQFRALSGRYRTVVVHHPGVGASTAPTDLSLASITDSRTEVLDRLGTTGPVHVVGASFGGLLAQAFALRHPERTASLTLICGSFRYANREGGVNRLERVVAEDLDRIVSGSGSPRIARDRDRLTELLLRSESMDARTGLRYLDLFAGEPDLRERLPEISVPTLLVQGRHDSVIPLKTAHLMHGLIPDATYEEIPDAGHFPCVTHPDEVNRLLAAFLDRTGRRP